MTTERLVETYNADLANGLGNLVSRLLALGERTALSLSSRSGGVPVAPPGYAAALEAYQLDRALATLWSIVRDLDREIDRTAPWKLPEAEARPHLARWLARLDDLAYWLGPFLPRAATEIRRRLGPGPVRRGPPLFPRIG